MMRRLIFALAIGFAAPLWAQTPAPGEPARALIEEQRMGDLFTAVEGEDFMVRHTASGLTCNFVGDDQRRVLATFEGLPRGEDVACIAERPGLYTTLYATRYAPAITVQQALTDGIDAIRNRWPDARPMQPTFTMTLGDLQYLMQHFLITVNGEQYITTVMVAEADGWIFKLRYTEAAADDDALHRSQLLAGGIFLGALLKQREATGLPPRALDTTSPT